MNCPHCEKQIDMAGGAPRFCPWCGKALSAEELPSALAEILKRIDAEDDTAKKHELLVEAQRQYPNNRELEKRLLFLGRLYERGGKPDFYRIPYWPLNALEKPSEFSKKQRQEMLGRFFGNPEIDRVSKLFDDPDEFRREYFRRMAADYVDLFIKKAVSNNNILFFHRSAGGKMGKYLESLEAMLSNIPASPFVPGEYKSELTEALILGFEDVFGAGSAETLRQRYM